MVAVDPSTFTESTYSAKRKESTYFLLKVFLIERFSPAMAKWKVLFLSHFLFSSFYCNFQFHNLFEWGFTMIINFYDNTYLISSMLLVVFPISGSQIFCPNATILHNVIVSGHVTFYQINKVIVWIFFHNSKSSLWPHEMTPRAVPWKHLTYADIVNFSSHVVELSQFYTKITHF